MQLVGVRAVVSASHGVNIYISRTEQNVAALGQGVGPQAMVYIIECLYIA